MKNNIISGDVEFIQMIEDSTFYGLIHSIFKRTINIQCLANRELYTIACSEIDNAPNTLVLNLESFEKTHLKVKDKVFVRNNILFIADQLAISLEHCTKWKSILPEYPIDVTTIKKNLTILAEYIDIHGISGGMKQDFSAQNPFEIETSRMLVHRSQELIENLLNNQLPTALQDSRGLIGLGPGLTPSGDDFLVGLLSTFNIRKSPLYNLKGFGEEVVKIARELTNDISFMAIKQASIGRVRESIIHLVHSIFYDNDEKLIHSLNKVLNIGSSSGTDIVLGLVCGLEANIKAGGR